MATNVLILGTATDGPSNTCVQVNNLTTLKQTFGGEYIQNVSLTATATSAILDYTPQTTVKNSDTLLTGILYSPTVQDKTLYFGSIGGTGKLLNLHYCPYTESSDIISNATYLLENGQTNFYCGRLGGVSANCDLDDWVFTSKYRGIKYNNISLDISTSGIIFEAFENYPEKTYFGDVDTVVSKINRDCDSGLLPFYISKYNIEAFPPDDTYTLSNGSDGAVDFNSINEFLDINEIPYNVTHVVVLGHIDNNIMGRISDFYNDNFNQLRQFCFQVPRLVGGVNYSGGLVASTTFGLQNPFAPINTFEATLSGTVLSTIEGCSISPTGAIVVDNLNPTTSGYVAYSGTKSLRLFPVSSGALTFTPPANKKISSFGFWSCKGSESYRLTAFDQNNIIYETTSLTGVVAEAKYFFGCQFNKPATRIELLLIDTDDHLNTTIDDVTVGVVASAGNENNVDDIMSYLRQLQIRHPFVTLFAGTCDLSINGQTWVQNSVNAVSLILLENDGLLTNKPSKILRTTPNYAEPEIEFAYLNGINVFRRWIGNNSVAVDSSVCSDSTFSYNYNSKVCEIQKHAVQYLRKFLGNNLQQGYQSNLSNTLKGILDQIKNITIEDVTIYLNDGVLTVFIQGLIFSQILKISFNVMVS
jgi:hypothetical protein